MKWNWGHGITAFIIGFMLFMAILVYKTFTVEFDLVSEDYYAQEMAYEDRMNQVRNLNALGEAPEVLQGNEAIVVKLPEEHLGGSKGTLVFYNPADKESDRLFEFEADQGGILQISKEELTAAYYEVRIQWEYENKAFYHTSDLHLNRQ